MEITTSDPASLPATLEHLSDDDPHRLVADLQTVLAIARACGAERDLSRLLPTIVAGVTQLVGSDRSSLFLVEGNDLTTSVAEGTTEIRIKIGTGIAGTVAATGETINIKHAYADPRFRPDSDRRTGYRTFSILCMPLRDHDGTIVGVLQTLNKRNGQPFDARDEHVLAALCAQAGVALATARLVARDRERQRLERDLELARQIQVGLHPDAANFDQPRAGWRLAAWSQSCDQTGGDYHDLLVGAEGSLDAVIGDVSGHGIAAALSMCAARAFLRALHSASAAPPALPALLAGVNRLLCADLDDERFMTLCQVRLHADGNAAYVAAGHEPPLIYRADAGFDPPGQAGLPLGMFADSDYADAFTIVPTLHAGDCVVLTTDGLADAGAENGQAFGQDALRELIASHAHLGADRLRRALVARILAHLGDRAPHDDMTLLIAERR